MGRTIDTRGRILETTIQYIDQSGEHLVRLRDIADTVGIKEPTIYHYFENREALLEAAQIERYRRSYLEMTTPLRLAVEMADTREEFQVAIRKVFEWSYKPNREQVRAIRAHVMGLAQRSPSMAVAVRAVNAEICEGVAEIFTKALSHNWMRTDLDPIALAYWSIGQLNGRVMAEMDPTQVDLPSWDFISIQAVMGLIDPDR